METDLTFFQRTYYLGGQANMCCKNLAQNKLTKLLLILCLLPAVCLVGCAKQDPYLRQIQKSGVLRVGIDPSWPPFEFVDEQGQVAGLDVELAQAIGDQLGVKTQFFVSGWEGLYDALRTGQFDAAISALPYDPWRTRTVAYSLSYFNAGPVIVAPAGENGVDEPQDLRGRVVHVEFGSEGEVQARRLQKQVPDLTVTSHDTAQEALAALAERAGGAAIVDAVSARLFIRQDSRCGELHGSELYCLRVVGEPLYEEPYVIAVHIEARSLQRAIDQALNDLRESGELDALLDRWL